MLPVFKTLLTDRTSSKGIHNRRIKNVTIVLPSMKMYTWHNNSGVLALLLSHECLLLIHKTCRAGSQAAYLQYKLSKSVQQFLDIFLIKNWKDMLNNHAMFASVCQSVSCNNLRTAEWISMIFDVGEFYRILSAYSNFGSSRTTVSITLHEDLHVFLCAEGNHKRPLLMTLLQACTTRQ